MAKAVIQKVEEIISLMESPNEESVALVKKAYELGKRAHRDHKRKSGEPYFIHPIETAKTLAELGMDAPTIAAGILHDSIEDAAATEDEMRREFGDEVLFLVEGVTKLGHIKYQGLARHAESLRRLLVATSQDVRVLIIKFADRLHNMNTLQYVSKEKRERIALETLEVYAPIAERLGMGILKRDLEDLAFPYIDPKNYERTLELRKEKKIENEQRLEKVLKSVKKELANGGITNFRTEIRIKGLYSLFKKLERKGGDITKVYDISALRIIVPSIADCYKVLGIIHSLWRPLPGKIKDYISFEKPNGYQSLHTTVFTGDGGVVEIQIRTEKMNREAKYGVASHLSYKELGGTRKSAFERMNLQWSKLMPALLNISPPEKEKDDTKKSIAEIPGWLREIAEAHKEIAGPEDFLESLKTDFFSHRILVFTPKNDVIDLPTDSSPVDFAYKIHSEVGDHISGVKVNGKMVSLGTKLKNGDMVEIITKQSARPSPKWVEYAKTTFAKQKIRSALHKLQEHKRS